MSNTIPKFRWQPSNDTNTVPHYLDTSPTQSTNLNGAWVCQGNRKQRRAKFKEWLKARGE